MDWWRRSATTRWRETLRRKAAEADHPDRQDSPVNLRACTYAERPFGDEAFVDEMAERFRRRWRRGRPSKRSSLKPREKAAQFRLFTSPDPAKL
jgi:hypothetical protein